MRVDGSQMLAPSATVAVTSVNSLADCAEIGAANPASKIATIKPYTTTLPRIACLLIGCGATHLSWMNPSCQYSFSRSARRNFIEESILSIIIDRDLQSRPASPLEKRSGKVTNKGARHETFIEAAAFETVQRLRPFVP